MKLATRSLFVKVYFWFWIITVSIVCVLLLVNPLNYAAIHTEPLRQNELDNFARFSEVLSRVLSNRSQPLLSNSPPKLTRKRYLYFYNASDGLTIQNKPLPINIDVSLLNEINTESPMRLISEQFTAIGPVDIELDSLNYAMFELFPDKGATLGSQITLAPLWVKVAVVIFVSTVLVFFFTQSFVRPILALRDSAVEISKGKLSSRVKTNMNRKDEIAQLCAEFNDMADKLERAVNNQKRLFRDISHELRSPLRRLSTANEIAANMASSELRPYLNRIETESLKLEGIIEELLIYSRLQAQQEPVKQEKTDLFSLLSPIISQAEFDAHSREKTLVISQIEPINMVTDKRLTTRALENLLSNAVRYAALNVCVNVRVTNTLIIIDIEDDGEGVDDDALQELAKPFYRVATSRERDTGGSGIGLAIANSAVRIQQGALEFSHASTGGLKASVILPLL